MGEIYLSKQTDSSWGINHYPKWLFCLPATFSSIVFIQKQLIPTLQSHHSSIRTPATIILNTIWFALSLCWIFYFHNCPLMMITLLQVIGMKRMMKLTLTEKWTMQNLQNQRSREENLWHCSCYPNKMKAVANQDTWRFMGPGWYLLGARSCYFLQKSSLWCCVMQSTA